MILSHNWESERMLTFSWTKNYDNIDGKSRSWWRISVTNVIFWNRREIKRSFKALGIL